MSDVDHRNLVIEILADSEAALVDRVAELEADVTAYRGLALAAIGELHWLTVERDRSRASHDRLLDEYRHLRAQTRRQAAVA